MSKKEGAEQKDFLLVPSAALWSSLPTSQTAGTNHTRHWAVVIDREQSTQRAAVCDRRPQ